MSDEHYLRDPFREVVERPPLGWAVDVVGLVRDGRNAWSVARQHIDNADRVVAIVDHPNANVGWELGFAWGRGKEVLLAAARDSRPEWLDTAGWIAALVTQTGVVDVDELRAAITAKADRGPPVEPRPSADGTLVLCPGTGAGKAIGRQLSRRGRRLLVGPMGSLDDLPAKLRDVKRVVWVIPQPLDTKRDDPETVSHAVAAGFAEATGREVAVFIQRGPRTLGDVSDRAWWWKDGDELNRQLDTWEATREPVQAPIAVDPDRRAELAGWLEELFRARSAREDLLRRAGIDARYGTWPEIVAGLEHSHLVALVKATGEPDAAEWVTRLNESHRTSVEQQLLDVRSALTERLQRSLDSAMSAYDAGKHAEAGETLADVVRTLRGTGPLGEDQRRLVARATLMHAYALDHLGQRAKAVTLTEEIDWKLLTDDGRAALARLLAFTGRHDDAFDLVRDNPTASARAIRDLVALLRGEHVESPAEDADVLLTAAARALTQERPAVGVGLALRAMDVPMADTGARRCSLLLAVGLLMSWVTGDDVHDPEAALSVLRDKANDREDWPEVTERIDGILEPQRAAPRAFANDELSLTVLESPWADSLREALEGDDDALLAFSRQERSGAAQFNVARIWLLRGRPDRALQAATRAFETLPGRGQRRVLIEALLRVGRDSEARAHVAQLDDDSAETWNLRLRVEGGPPHQVLALAQEYAQRHADVVDAQVWVARAALLAGKMGVARVAADRVVHLGLHSLSLDSLHVLALIAVEPPVQRNVGAAVGRALLAVRGSERARAEMLRMPLVQAGLDEEQLDGAMLESIGAIRAFTPAQIADTLQAQLSQVARLDRLRSVGGIAFDVWADVVNVGTGTAAWAIRTGQYATRAPAIPSHVDAAALKGRRCLVSALTVEVLHGAGLLDAFANRVARVVMFRSTQERLVVGGIDPFAGGAERDAEILDRALDAISGHHDASPEAGTGLDEGDVDDVIGWLAREGERAGPTTDAMWAPDSSGVVLGQGVRGLARHGALEMLIDALERRGIPVLAAHGLRASLTDARKARRHQREMRRESSEIRAWIATLADRNKLELLEPVLPAETEALAEDAQRQRLRSGHAFREALAADADLLAITSELIEVGIAGRGPDGLEGALPVPDSAWEAMARRHEVVLDRVVSVGVAARSLAGPRRAEVAEQLASAGFPDAMGGDDVIALADRYGELIKPAARRAIEGLCAGCLGQDRATHHHILADAVAANALGPAIVRLWCKPEGPDKDAHLLTGQLLSLAMGIDRQATGTIRLTDLTVHWAVMITPGGADEQWIVDMWGAVRAWAAVDPTRAVVARLGVGAALYSMPPMQPAWMANVIHPVSRVAKGGPPWDLAADPMDPVLARRDLRGLLHVLSIDDTPVAAVLDDAMERIHRGEFVLDGIALRAGDMRVPLPAALPAVPVERRAELADRLEPWDARLATQVRNWVANPTDQHRDAASYAAWASPAVDLREDPTLIAFWGVHLRRGAVIGRPVTHVDDLREILDEPDDDVSGLRPRIRKGGPWATCREAYILRMSQLACLPGAVVGLLSGYLDPEVAAAIEGHRNRPIGHVAAAIVTLAMAGRVKRYQTLGERSLTPPQLAAQLAVAALDEATPEADSIAALEPRVIRLCRHVVGNLGDTRGMSPSCASWLAWRLYGWLMHFAAVSADPPRFVRALAELAPPALPPQSADLWDAATLPDDGRELREVHVLEAIAAAVRVGDIDHALLIPTLERVAQRPLTDREATIRTGAGAGPLGGPGLIAPDLALALLLDLDREAFWRLPADTRALRIDDALAAPEAYSPAGRLRQALRLEVAGSPQRWSSAEVRQIVASLGEGIHDVPGRAELVVAAWRHEPALADAAWEALRGRLHDADDPTIGEWLVSAAHHGDLYRAVERLRAELAGRDDADEGAVLQHLARVLFQDDPACVAQFHEVLARLKQEPALAAPGALGELIALVEGGA